MLKLTQFFIHLSALNFILSFILDVELVFLTTSVFFFHFILGLNSILTDYLHLNKIKIFFLFFIRISLIEILREFLEILF